MDNFAEPKKMALANSNINLAKKTFNLVFPYFLVFTYYLHYLFSAFTFTKITLFYIIAIQYTISYI